MSKESEADVQKDKLVRSLFVPGCNSSEEVRELTRQIHTEVFGITRTTGNAIEGLLCHWMEDLRNLPEDATVRYFESGRSEVVCDRFRSGMCRILKPDTVALEDVKSGCAGHRRGDQEKIMTLYSRLKEEGIPWSEDVSLPCKHFHKATL